LSRPIIDRLHSESHQGNGIIDRLNHQRLLQQNLPGGDITSRQGQSNSSFASVSDSWLQTMPDDCKEDVGESATCGVEFTTFLGIA
jgi:hypothetical protein